MTRRCWCNQSPSTCPVHAVGSFVQNGMPGEALFQGITAREALSKLRFMLAALGVEKSEIYRSHDIRRGHALDLQCAGVHRDNMIKLFLLYLQVHRSRKY